MKKIPTLFEREYHGDGTFTLTDRVHPGCEAVLQGMAIATEKFDGSCIFVAENGDVYRRYDAKRGRTPPPDAIPCCEPDQITGHWPHWLPLDEENPADRWHIEAIRNMKKWMLTKYCNDEYEKYYSWMYNHTLEVVGQHFQNNPYCLDKDIVVPHGKRILIVEELTFDGIRKYLETHSMEGIVFWMNGQPLCKIKRSDYGIPWNGYKATIDELWGKTKE